MKRLLFTISAILFSASLFGQGSDDALLYSQTQYQGTAKALGMANALGAVGGDMTATCINPAGLGLYRSDEFTASLNLLNNLNHSNYYGEANNANKTRLTIPNIGYVSTKQRSNYRNLRFTQFGIGLTRTNDFNNCTYAKGINPTSSLIYNYLSKIDGFSTSDIQNYYPFDIYPAWQTYLIDIYNDDLGEYYGSPIPQGGIWQSHRNNFKGRSEEWTFASSANYADRLFLGISLGMGHIKREGTREFGESLPYNSDISTDFRQWSFTENISSIGWGFNIKTGLIYHASNWLRIGAAFHSPTIYGFEETWQTETTSLIEDITKKYISQESHYEYTFISPLKWVGSMAFVVGQEAIVSLDAEYTNYGAARFKANDYDYGNTNVSIRETFGRTANFRIGAEWRMGNSYLRLGGGYYGSPYGLGDADGSLKKASAGISLPLSLSTTVDFAYELTLGKSLVYLYDAGSLGIDPISQSQYRNNVAVTLKARY